MESSNHLRIKNPDIGYITIDRDGRVCSCNDQAAALLDTTPEVLLEQTIHAAIESDPRFEPLIRRLKRREFPLPNEQFDLPNFHAGKKDSLTVRIVSFVSEQGAYQGAYIGLIDRSSAVTARILALNSIAEGVFTVDEEMKITSFNEAAEKMTGWSQQEVLGKPCKTVFKSNICGNSCALSSATANNCNIVVDRDVYITRKNGSSFPVRISATPLINEDNQIIGGVEIFRDISELVQSDLIISAVADGVVTFDEKGIITSFNSGAQQITGWSEEEVVGRSCDEMFFGADSVVACPIMQTDPEAEPCNIIDQDGYVVDKDGYNIPISVSITPMLDGEREPIGCVQTFRDNTQALQKKLILDSIADGVFTVDRN